MEFDRFSGKTLEEALQNAAKGKNVDVDELHYEVVEEKAGFLGIGKTVEISVYTSWDIANFIADYIQAFFDNANLEGSVAVSQEADDFFKVYVDTNANAVLIGKNGKTLQDFNRLVKAAASAQFKRRVRLLIDVNNYKEDRYEKLSKMAKRIARDVQRTHMDAVLEPMPADERKAVHNALSKMRYISTKSQGEGAERRLHILYTPGKEEE